MALLWIEGFEGFGTSSAPNGLSRKYNPYDVGSDHVYMVAGRFGGYALDVAYYAGSHGYITTPTLLGSVPATIIVGFALKRTSFINDDGVVSIQNTSGSSHVDLLGMSDGKLKVLVAGGQTYTTTDTLATGTWKYYELKVVIDNSAGSFTLKCDGIVLLTQSGLDTQASTNVRVRFGNAGSTGGRYSFDDIYILDSTGTANNDFLGPRHVEAIFPGGDGDSLLWTPSSGTDHYALVDENPANDDTDYLETAAAAKDYFQYGNLTRITSGINGVQVNTELRATDANAFNFRMPAKSGSTESAGATLSVSGSSYFTKSRILEQDPATSAAWAAAGVNAAQFGIEVL